MPTRYDLAMEAIHKLEQEFGIKISVDYPFRKFEDDYEAFEDSDSEGRLEVVYNLDKIVSSGGCLSRTYSVIMSFVIVDSRTGSRTEYNIPIHIKIPVESSIVDLDEIDDFARRLFDYVSFAIADGSLPIEDEDDYQNLI